MNAESASEVDPLVAEPYRPERFVGRERELKLVEEKVVQAQSGLDIRGPLVNFWGVSGIGKSWLLRRIQERYHYKSQVAAGGDKTVFTLYYSFEEDEIPVLTTLSQALAQSIPTEVQSDLLTEKERAQLEQVTLSGNIERLVQLILSLAKQSVPLLLLDATEKLEPEFWHELEVELLEPLLESDRILIIIAGRHRAPRWRRVEVRRRAAPAAESQVTSFDVETLADQFQGLGLRTPDVLARKLYRYTAGNPLLATHIGPAFLESVNGEKLERLQPAKLEAFRPVLLQLLKAYQVDVFERVSDELQSYIRLLASLRFYRTEALRHMLLGVNHPEAQAADIRLLQILRQLEGRTDVVWWDDSRNGYVTAPIVRRVINQQLLLKDRPQFIATHQRALALYWQWTEQYPENSAVYLAEICFHQAMIDKAREERPRWLTDFKRILASVQKLDIDKRMILPNKLREDKELENLLGTELYNALTKDLDSLVDGGTDD